MPNALFLQGWQCHPQDHFYPWLINQLNSKNYSVDFPELPSIYTDDLDMSAMLDFLSKEKLPKESSLVIGHSIGAVLGLRLAETKPLEKLILISGWDFNDLTPEHQSFWPNLIDHDKIKQNVKEIIVFHSDNEPYINTFQAKNMAKRLNAQYVEVKGAGHFLKENGITQIPELLNYL